MARVTHMRNAIAASCCRVERQSIPRCLVPPVTKEQKTIHATQGACQNLDMPFATGGRTTCRQAPTRVRRLAVLRTQHNAALAYLIAYAVPLNAPRLEALPVDRGKQAHGIHKGQAPAQQRYRL